MAFTVKDVIIEALARSNLVSRRQPAPGNMVENAFQLLKGIAADYSSHNLLQFLRRELNIASDEWYPIPMKSDLILGTLDPEIPDDYVDVQVDKLEKITELYWKRSLDPMANADMNLDFVSFEDFNKPEFGIYIYTWQPISDTKVALKLKPRFVNMLRGNSKYISLIYNVKYEMELNSVLKIPDIYKELFTCALTYKLAVAFPRLSPEHTERLKNTLKEIEDSIKTPTRANKFIRRTSICYDNKLVNSAQLNSGSFIFPA